MSCEHPKVRFRNRYDNAKEQTGADELIFTCDLYDFADRLHAFELVAQLR